MAGNEKNPLGSAEVSALLRRARIPTPREVFAGSVDDVPPAFDKLAAKRVVLKAAGLLHKTDLGGVVLDIQDGRAAEFSAKRMLDRIGPSVLPFLLQEQVDGFEMLVGVHRVPELGVAVAVGIGGVHAELHRDVTYRFAPVTTADALQMLAGLRSWPLLNGYRGSPRRDIAALADVIVKIAALAVSDPSIRELDLNPVIVNREGDGCVVADARIITGEVWLPPRRPTRDLDRVLHPRHIAVVGVSDDVSKVGARLFRYLRDHGFSGRLDPVHPTGGQFHGFTRYSTLAEVDGSPDLVCVAVPARYVPEVAQQAVDISSRLGAGAQLRFRRGG